MSITKSRFVKEVDTNSPAGKVAMFGYRSGLMRALELINDKFVWFSSDEYSTDKNKSYTERHTCGVLATIIKAELDASLGKAPEPSAELLDENRRKGKISGT